MSLPRPSAYFGTTAGTDANGTPVADPTPPKPRWSYHTGILSLGAKCPGCNDALRNHTVVTYVGLAAALCVSCLLDHLTERDALLTKREGKDLQSFANALASSMGLNQANQQNSAAPPPAGSIGWAASQTGGLVPAPSTPPYPPSGPAHTIKLDMTKNGTFDLDWSV